MSKYTESDAAVVRRASQSGIDLKQEVINGVGLRVELGEDDSTRYVDAVLASPELSLINSTLRRAC